MVSDLFNHINRQMWMQQNESHSPIYSILKDLRNDLKKESCSAPHSDINFVSGMYTVTNVRFWWKMISDRLASFPSNKKTSHIR